MHHVHISTSVILLCGLFLFGVVTVIAATIASIKRERAYAQALVDAERDRRLYAQQQASGTPGVSREGSWRDGPVYHAAPTFAPVVAPAPYYYDPYFGLAEAAIIGGVVAAEAAVIGGVMAGGAGIVDTYDAGCCDYDSGGIDISFD